EVDLLRSRLEPVVAHDAETLQARAAEQGAAVAARAARFDERLQSPKLAPIERVVTAGEVVVECGRRDERFLVSLERAAVIGGAQGLCVLRIRRLEHLFVSQLAQARQ